MSAPTQAAGGVTNEQLADLGSRLQVLQEGVAGMGSWRASTSRTLAAVEASCQTINRLPACHFLE